MNLCSCFFGLQRPGIPMDIPLDRTLPAEMKFNVKLLLVKWTFHDWKGSKTCSRVQAEAKLWKHHNNSIFQDCLKSFILNQTLQFEKNVTFFSQKTTGLCHHKRATKSWRLLRTNTAVTEEDGRTWQQANKEQNIPNEKRCHHVYVMTLRVLKINTPVKS